MFPMITYYGRDVAPILRTPSKEIERTVLRKRSVDPEEEARRRALGASDPEWPLVFQKKGRGFVIHLIDKMG